MAVHTDLVAKGIARWSSQDIPDMAALPYEMLTAYDLAPKFPPAEQDKAEVAQAMSALFKITALPTSRRAGCGRQSISDAMRLQSLVFRLSRSGTPSRLTRRRWIGPPGPQGPPGSAEGRRVVLGHRDPPAQYQVRQGRSGRRVRLTRGPSPGRFITPRPAAPWRVRRRTAPPSITAPRISAVFAMAWSMMAPR